MNGIVQMLGNTYSEVFYNALTLAYVISPKNYGPKLIEFARTWYSSYVAHGLK